MQANTKNLAQYFSHRAALYDCVYENTAGIFARYWWRPLLANKNATLEVLGDLSGKSVLEIGCGTGHLAVAMAKRGASVTAIDISPEMIRIGSKNATRSGVADKIQFMVADFMDIKGELTHRHDWVIALTVFDYSLDPENWLGILSSWGGKLIATFPSKSLFSTIIRNINSRLWGSFPLRFYSEAEVNQLLTKTGWRILRIQKVHSTYLIYAGRPDISCR